MEMGTYPIDPSGHSGRGGSSILSQSTCNSTQSSGTPSWLSDLLSSFNFNFFFRRKVFWMDGSSETTMPLITSTDPPGVAFQTNESSSSGEPSGVVEPGRLHHPFVYKSAYLMLSPSGDSCEPQATAFHGW